MFLILFVSEDAFFAVCLCAEITEYLIFLVLRLVTLEAISCRIQLFFIQLSISESLGSFPDFLSRIFEYKMRFLQHPFIVILHVLNAKHPISILVHPNDVRVCQFLKSDIVDVKVFPTLNHKSELVSISLMDSFMIDSLHLADEFIRIVMTI